MNLIARAKLLSRGKADKIEVLVYFEKFGFSDRIEANWHKTVFEFITILHPLDGFFKNNKIFNFISYYGQPSGDDYNLLSIVDYNKWAYDLGIDHMFAYDLKLLEGKSEGSHIFAISNVTLSLKMTEDEYTQYILKYK